MVHLLVPVYERCLYFLLRWAMHKRQNPSLSPFFQLKNYSQLNCFPISKNIKNIWPGDTTGYAPIIFCHLLFSARARSRCCWDFLPPLEPWNMPKILFKKTSFSLVKFVNTWFFLFFFPPFLLFLFLFLSSLCCCFLGSSVEVETASLSAPSSSSSSSASSTSVALPTLLLLLDDPATELSRMALPSCWSSSSAPASSSSPSSSSSSLSRSLSSLRTKERKKERVN